MKKQFLLLFAAIALSFTAVVAQDGRPKMSSEERVKMTMEKIAPLTLSDEAKSKAAIIFKEFYDAQATAMKAMRESGNMDREAMKTKRDQLAKERDDKLKKIFTEEQFKKWQEEIEPTLRPQRGSRS